MSTAASVLVIEDEDKLRRAMVAYLEDSGYIISEAANGREGLESFTRNKTDLVLTDLRMPEKNGIEVVKWMTQNSPDTPVIVITGTGDQHAVDTAMAAGARMYFIKPISDLAELDAAIRSLIR